MTHLSEERSTVQYSHRIWYTYENRLIKMCLNKTCSNNLSDAFPVQNGLKHGDEFFSTLF
jgi:hypothetical protein